MSVGSDMLLCTDGVSIELFAEQAEEPSNGLQELRTCNGRHKAQFRHKQVFPDSQSCQRADTWLGDRWRAAEFPEC